MQGIETIIKTNRAVVDALARARANRDAGIPLTPGQVTLLAHEEWKADVKAGKAPLPGAEQEQGYTLKYGSVYKNGIFQRAASVAEIESGVVREDEDPSDAGGL